MGNDWKEVILDGMKIDLRDRERAKEFLRYLWENGAKRRSNAIPVAGKFPKPSSLFSPGEKFVSRGRGNTEKDVPVKSELGTRIHRVYQDAVGLVKPKKGTGPHKYFLRAFPDSDKT